MCGIVGFISAQAKGAVDRNKFMQQALIIDTLRGDDGTGTFVVPRIQNYDVNEGRAGFLKKVCDGYQFTQASSWYNFFGADKVGGYKFAVGHNRSATVGSLSVEATHPFQIGPITLVHNGTLWTTIDLPFTSHEIKAPNDSYTICYNLAYGEVEEVVSNLDGAFTLVWHDARDDSLNIVRNKDRPLHMSRSHWNDSIYFASEGEMLHWLDARLQLGLQEIVQPKVGFWMKFQGDDLMKPTVKEIKIRTRTVTQSSDYDAAWWNTYAPSQTSYVIGDPPQGKAQDATTTTHTADTTTSTATINVDGRERAVPTILQEELLELDLLVDDKVAFVPEEAKEVFITNKNLYKKNMTVCGYVVLDANHPAHCFSAMIYGVRESVWASANYRVWTVRPLGVKHDANGETILICRFKSSLSPHNKVTNIPNSLNDVLNVGDDNNEDADDLVMVPGPNGTMVSKADFYKVTQGGCIDCQGAVYAIDAYQILWVNHGQDPLCPTCVEDRYTTKENI